MSWWQALIMGVVEGLTEYLPISSTGHLILTAWLLGLDTDPELRQATNTFNIVIQGGAILAVLWLYPRRVSQIFTGFGAALKHRGVFGGKAQPLATLADTPRNGFRLAMNLLVAFLPAAILGPLLDDWIDSKLMNVWPVVAALFVGGVGMIAFARLRRVRRAAASGLELENLTWQMALAIGVLQCFAMWPGTSRSMMTIVAALLLGLRPRAAAEFSFLLGLITLGAATAYKAVSAGDSMLEHIHTDTLAIGLVAAAISAAVAMKFFVTVLVRYGMAPFGWYRIALSIAFVLAVLAGHEVASATGE